MILYNFKTTSIKNYTLIEYMKYILIDFSKAEHSMYFLNFPQILIIMLNTYVSNDFSLLKLFPFNVYT